MIDSWVFLIVSVTTVGLILTGLLLFLLVSAGRGAAEEVGRAALAEAAPWVAQAVATLAVRVILIRRPEARRDLLDEVQSLVDAEFHGRKSPADRVCGIFGVLGQTISLLAAAGTVRSQPLQDGGRRAKVPQRQDVIDDRVSVQQAYTQVVANAQQNIQRILAHIQVSAVIQEDVQRVAIEMRRASESLFTQEQLQRLAADIDVLRRTLGDPDWKHRLNQVAHGGPSDLGGIRGGDQS